MYGGNLFEKPRYNPKHSRAFELRIGARSAVFKLLCDVLPHLICKREQAELGLAFLTLGKVKMKVIGHRKIHPKKGGTHPILKAVDGEQEIREAAKQNLMLLNKRGA